MRKNTLGAALSAALVVAVVSAAVLVVPPEAASAAPLAAAVPATISASQSLDVDDHDVIDLGDDMLEVPNNAALRKAVAKAAKTGIENVGTVANPEVHELYFVVTAATNQTTDDDLLDLDETSVRAMVDRIHDYWFEESGGTIDFVFGGYETGAAPEGTTTCDTSLVFGGMQALSFNGDFHNSRWVGTNKHLTVLTREGDACGNEGFAYLGGEALGGGGGVIFSANGTTTSTAVEVMAHELGHNLGFRHASASICSSTTNFDSTIDQLGLGPAGEQLENNTAMQCPTEDYGDLSDIMGYTVDNSLPHLSTPLKIINNFLTDYTTVTPSNAGSFTLAPIGATATSGSVRALRVKDPTTGLYYYLEYRTQTGADTNSYSFYQSPTLKPSVNGYALAPYDGAAAVTNGAVRVLRQYNRDGFRGSTALAVSPTRDAPNDLQIRRPYLVPGQSFTNDKGVFTVTVDSSNTTTGAVVTVSYQIPTKTTLSLTPSSTQSYNKTPTVTATGKVSPVDGVDVAGSMTITADGTTVGTGAVNSSGEYSVSLPASLSIGTHNIKASFTPTSSTYVASESAIATLTVVATPTASTLMLSNSGTQAYNEGTRVTASASVAQVNGSYPAGSFEFRDGSTLLATTPADTAGVATHTFAADTNVGTHSITAKFVPTLSDFASSTATATLTVTATPTSVSLTLDRSSAQTYGTSTPVTALASVAELSTGGYASGSIEFIDGATVRATVAVSASGIASYTFSPTLGTGAHTITARFVPTSGNVAGSTSTAKTLTVSPAPTSTTLSLDRSGTQVFGSSQRVTATAAVAQVNGEYPAGTVAFRDGSTTLDTVTLSGTGTADYTFSATLAAGSHTITAIFTPLASSYAASTSDSSTLTVTSAATSTSLTLDSATQTYLTSAPVTATARVAQVSGSYPAGQIEFREGSSVLATVTTNGSGIATYAFSSTYAVGAHEITARFIPTSTSYLTSTSAAATLTVSAATTSAALALDRSGTQVFGTTTPVTATATVSAVSGVYPAGSFEFLDGTTVLGTVTANGTGVATLAFDPSTTVGTHSITARFVPTTSSFSGTTSTAKTLTVTAAPTSTTITLDRSGAQVYGSGDTVTVTATVAQVSGVYPAGSFEFRDGATVLATVSVGGTGTASYTFAANTSAGAHSITAKFVSGSTGYSDSTTTARTLTVTPTPTSVTFTLDRSATQVYGSSTRVTAQAAVAELAQGGYASGQVEFVDGSTVVATVAVSSSGIATYTFSSTLATGSHSITARFVPTSSNIAASTSAAKTLTVSKATTTTTLALDRSAEQTFAGTQRVTATATIADAYGAIQPGSIEFRDGATVLDTVTVGAEGTATYTFAASLSAGSHSITAIFTPSSASFSASTSDASTLTVRAAQTATTLSINQSGAQSYSGIPATATATVAAIAGVYPAGQVEFREGSSVLSTVTVNSSGVATYAFSSTLAAGTHDITARFVPTSSNYITSTSTASTLTVAAITTTTTLSLNTSSQTYLGASSVTATAQASPSSGSFTAGSMEFIDGTTVIATVAVNGSGTATYAFPSATAVGSHSITARFVPTSTNHTGSTSVARTLTVSAASTSTTISLDVSTQTYLSGSTATATGTVAPVSGVYPTGSIVFLDSTTQLASVPVSATGVATYTFPSDFGAGGHVLIARFVPLTSSFLTSTSSNQTAYLTVAQATSATQLSLDRSAQQFGTATPAVASASVGLVGGSYPAGNVVFLRGTTTIATVPLSSTGTAQTTLSEYLSENVYSITARFDPSNASIATSTSTASELTVSRFTAELALTLDNAATQVYDSSTRVTASASINALDNGTYTTGSFRFYDGGSNIVATVAAGTDGKASYTFARTLSVGSHNIRIDFLPSTSNSVNGASTNAQVLIVTKAPTAATLSLDNGGAQTYRSGEVVTATATVAPVNGVQLPGTVTFRDGSTDLDYVDVVYAEAGANGVAVSAFSTHTTAGTHTITAVFTPNSSSYAASTSAARTLTVTRAVTTATLSLERDSQVYLTTNPNSATASVSVASGDLPDGVIEFRDGTTVLTTTAVDSSGAAWTELDITLAVGSHSITAHFIPTNSSYAESTSAPSTLLVTGAPTSTTLELDRSGTQALGTDSPVTATGTVAPVRGITPAGWIEFSDGSTVLATVPTSQAGVATHLFSDSTTVGTHDISARFVPAGTSFLGSTTANPTPLTVTPGITTTTITLSRDGLQSFNKPATVVVTATIATVAGVYPAGSFHFYDGTTELGSAAAISGSASYTASPTLAIGSHAITAQFVPTSASYLASTSDPSTLTVSSSSSRIVLALDNDSQVYGSENTVTAIATVDDLADGTLAGVVSFFEGSTLLGTDRTNDSGNAYFRFDAAYAVGSHIIRATFAPDSVDVAASATAVAQTFEVRQIGTTLNLELNQNGQLSYHGYPVTAGLYVMRDDYENAIGTVTFYSDTTALGTVAYAGGYLEFELPTSIAAGTHTITAKFAPTSPTIAPGTSNGATLTVFPNESFSTFQLSYPSQQEYLSANVATATFKVSTYSYGLPTGQVIFRDGSTVLDTITLVEDPAANFWHDTAMATLTFPSTLSVGTHQITAEYISSDPSILEPTEISTATLTVTEAQPAGVLATGLSLDNSSAQTFGSSSLVTATATVTAEGGSLPAGTVQFVEVNASQQTETVLKTSELGSSGAVTYTFPSNTPGGSHTIVARFTPTGQSQVVESATKTLRVNAAQPVVTVALDRSATQVYNGSPTVTATVVVTPIEGVVSNGSFILTIDGATVGTFVSAPTGTAELVLPNTLSAGTHTIGAIFSSQSSSYLSAPATTAALTVTAAATSTHLTLDRSGTQAYGDSRTVTATGSVAEVGGVVPTGSMRFFDGTDFVANLRVSDVGIAKYTFPAGTTAGTHSITAEFVPDPTSNFLGSTSSPATLTVSIPVPTTTSIALSAASQTFGAASPITATATVSVPGTVEFIVDGVSRSTVTVESGTARFAVGGKQANGKLLPAGNHSVTARFVAASTDYAASTGAATFSVAKVASSITLKTSKATQTYGSTSRATLTATVSANAMAVGGGTVTFRYGTLSSIVTAASNGTATFVLPQLTKVGKQSVTATFTPNDLANVVGKTSTATTITVAKATSKSTLALGATSIKKGKTSKATVTVAVSGIPAPTGTITLYSNGKKVASYSLAASKKGKLAIVVPKIAKKSTVKLTVKYSGDANIGASTSAAKSLKVK